MRRAITLFVLFLTLGFARGANAQDIITTVAGGGPNNLPALSANLNSPIAVAVDSAGNFYIAAPIQHRIFKVDTSGQLTVVAGTGAVGFGGDGGPAAQASLTFPSAVAVDPVGNVFIADRDNNRIRRVDATTGIITTVAGNGSQGFSGDGSPATSARLARPGGGLAFDSAGNLFIGDSTFNHRIRRVDTGADGQVSGASDEIITTVAGSGPTGFGAGGFNGDGGPATSARLANPLGVAVDSGGNLFIGDTNNNRIRRVDALSGIITTVAGGGSGGDGGPATSASLASPFGVAVDSAGNLFITDRFNHRIRRVDAATGIITTVAGTGGFGSSGDGGPATSARLAFPADVDVDGAGNLFIADLFNNRIRRVDAASGIITAVAGGGSGGDGGPATSASLVPSGVVLDSASNLFIADSTNHRIRRVDTATGIITTVAGTGSFGFSGDGGPATSASLASPFGVAFDSAGNLFIADVSLNRIRRVDTGADGQVTGASDEIFTTVAGGGSGGDGGPATSASLASPFGVAVDSAGNLFITDRFNHRIRRVDTGADGQVTGASDEIITTVAGNGISGFTGDGGPATSASLSLPHGVAVDGAGNLFIADVSDRRIRRVDTGADGQVTGASDEIITTVAGNGTFGFSGDGGPAASASMAFPIGVAVDNAGNFFIADVSLNRIRRVDALSGIITTVAGNGTFGFSGDGGPATSASVAGPLGVAVDNAGNLFIADQGNNRIRRVSSPTNQPPVADAGLDQGLECTSPTGTLVTLDGSASSDPDGDALTFTWTGPFPEGGGTVTGVNPAVTLPLGAFTITLVVNDGQVDSASDTVDITVAVRVEGLQSPLATLVPQGDPIPLPAKASKQGRTLPLKLRLFCGVTALTNADVSPPQIVALVRGGGDAIDLEMVDLDAGMPNDNGVFFRFSDPNWVYNLSTKALGSGTYTITLEMADGLRYTASFVLM